MFVTFCMKDSGFYLCFPLWSDSSNVLLYNVANVELLQKLGGLQKVLHELFDFILLESTDITKHLPNKHVGKVCEKIKCHTLLSL